MMICSGCEHKDLCLLHPHTAKMKIDVDWSKFIEKENPTGMTVMLYPHSNGQSIQVLSNTLSHVYAELEAGYYNSIAFNQSSTEFGTIDFKNLTDYNKAEAVVASSTATKWYSKSEDERIAVEPEWLGVDRFEMAHVAEYMIKQTQEEYSKSTRTKSRSTVEYTLGKHTPENVIYTVKVKIGLKRIYNLKKVRAALSGISEGVKLATGKTSENEVTYLLESWVMEQDPSNPVNGYVTATFTCFGLPSDHLAQAIENTITFSLLLVDNKTQLDYKLHVGDKFTTDEGKDLILYLNIEIDEPLPDVEPVDSSSGGFEATVDDWGEEIEHSILL